ncbi:outer membrane transport energization protein ExbD [Hydrocarboniphaga daqingensis]|uniref:Outer membrane transport energization protein ExbD n=1 Tax=Hydrocarboniphaga daqingensis TaxID=490188 RepID=A0A1M5QNQ3_9GAMM|nr:outer membrane transport energization protein ExbD [Hydrocarboniphaga daqingensis]
MQLARKPRRRNTIVLTSLVDVLFVLLFFFMLVTTFADWRSWSMNLGGVGDDADSGAAIVEVQADGGLRLDGRASDAAQVEQRLRQPGARAVLVAGSGVSLQALIDMLDRFKPTGAALTLGRAADEPAAAGGASR